MKVVGGLVRVRPVVTVSPCGIQVTVEPLALRRVKVSLVLSDDCSDAWLPVTDSWVPAAITPAVRLADQPGRKIDGVAGWTELNVRSRCGRSLSRLTTRPSGGHLHGELRS